MGGRGSASGISEKGIKYGEEYHTILAVDNIKYIQRNEGSQNSPIETMSAAKNRVYVVIRPDDKIKSVVFYDENGRRNRQIDFDHDHGRGTPHPHSGYDVPHTSEHSSLSAYEKKVIREITETWREYKNGK